MYKAAVIALSLLSLSACSTTTNWARLGQLDGEQGFASRNETQLAQRASETQPIDVAAYQQGYQRGLDRYCSADNGYQLGASGQIARNSCQSHANYQAFSLAYQQGWQRFMSPDWPR